MVLLFYTTLISVDFAQYATSCAKVALSGKDAISISLPFVLNQFLVDAVWSQSALLEIC